MNISTEHFYEWDGSSGVHYLFCHGPRRYTVRRCDATPVEASFIRYQENVRHVWTDVELDEFPGFDPLVQEIIVYLLDHDVFAVNFLRETEEVYEAVNVEQQLLAHFAW